MHTGWRTPRRRLLVGLAGLALTAASPGFAADAALPHAALGLDREALPLAARYRVQVQTGDHVTPRTLHWTFVREADRVAVHKGEISEAWTRGPQGGRDGGLSFERSFHAHAKVVDYSPGELATLGIRAEWPTLQRFVDLDLLQSLRLKSRSGQGRTLKLHLQGTVGVVAWQVDWLPALQLPARIERRAPGPAGSVTTTVTLQAQAATTPADWLPPPPAPGQPPYVRLDAADFGDMQREPVVRISEGLDLRGGWRLPHAHP